MTIFPTRRGNTLLTESRIDNMLLLCFNSSDLGRNMSVYFTVFSGSVRWRYFGGSKNPTIRGTVICCGGSRGLG